MYVYFFFRTKWLFSTSTAYYPSLYFSQSVLTSDQMIAQMIQGRIKESQRIIRTLNKVPVKPKIIPYIWLKYRDTEEYMTKVNGSLILSHIKSLYVLSGESGYRVECT